MNRPHFVRIVLLTALSLICSPVCSTLAESPPDPGPENGGLRLRFSVGPRPGQLSQAGFDVRVELLNVSQSNITLQTDWESNETGDVKDYLRAATQIETTPIFEPEHGATASREARTEPQKSLVLKAGEAVALRWQTTPRRLKANVSEWDFSLLGANPSFDEPGLYSVRITLDVPTGTGTVRLRSNEQLVSIGGSLKAPKPTAARIEHVSRNRQTARIDLGALDQVAPGDQFDYLSKTSSWRLTITDAYKHSSEGTLELLSNDLGDNPPAVGEFVTRVKKAVAAK
jgi:hypothetical protein